MIGWLVMENAVNNGKLLNLSVRRKKIFVQMEKVVFIDPWIQLLLKISN